MGQRTDASISRSEPSTVPDILHIICGYTSRAACVQIAYCSRIFFQVAIPHIWRELHGVHNLLSLIPSIKISQDSGNQKEITVPNGLDAVPNFSRYDIYAPSVHTIKVFDTLSRRYRVSFSSWTSLFKHSDLRPGGVLLPNLRKLDIHCEWCPLADRVNWIALLLAPSLLDIHVTADATNGILGIPDSRASALLELITQRCPSVRSLSLFPEPEDAYKHTTKDLIPLAPANLSCDHLANMQNLRSLTMSKIALQSDALLTIGLLSTLERLEIHDSTSQDIFSTLLPEFLFPSLRCLTLQMIDSFEVGQIWQMQPLVSRLTHVQINAKAPNMERERGLEPSGMTRHLPRMQFGDSPYIKSLSINFDILAASYNTSKLSPSGLTSMFQLPLQYLNLAMVKLKKFDVFCQMLAESCPTLCQLHIPSQPLALSELYHLTRLESIEHLSLRVLWHTLPDRSEGDWTRSSKSLTSLTYHYLKYQGLECSSNATAPEIARYFLDIWPSLTDITPAAGLNGTQEALPQQVAQIMAANRAASLCTCDMCSRQATQVV